ncbi:hypothetical protein L249_1689, partial [Ophiocordyceps polyrhachis-furcata BCC 54312]
MRASPRTISHKGHHERQQAGRRPEAVTHIRGRLQRQWESGGKEAQEGRQAHHHNRGRRRKRGQQTRRGSTQRPRGKPEGDRLAQQVPGTFYTIRAPATATGTPAAARSRGRAEPVLPALPLPLHLPACLRVEARLQPGRAV